MPNLRSQSITPDGISLVASDGRSFALTRAQVIAHFQTLSGSKPSKISDTIAWVKLEIETALGTEQVPAFLVDFDFDDIQGLRRLALGGLD